ncbi:MAG: nucleotidyltransferase family protein [Rothia sp. (in: high G+C Gram-positive bacteria)]|nr:nucleotidyltransferase family protein [Rothia sp. (in: high G+C Gram-positive bacteria)]
MGTLTRDTFDIPLKARITLSHAHLQHLANVNKIDILHIKGYAFGAEVYRPGRTSTDADILVRPAHVARFMHVLKDEGWQILTTFESGSVFEHASTIYHPAWGLTDVHRYFPGLGYYHQKHAFDLLWDARRTKEIANFLCQVPSLIDCRNIVVVHGARSSVRGIHPDVGYLLQKLDSQDWEAMRTRILEFDSEIAFDAALGEIDKHKDDRQYLFWKSFADTLPAPTQWLGRLQRAEGWRMRAKIILKILMVNEDHLTMDLGHTPTRAEKWALFFKRFERAYWWKKK